jgi:hypothetical protein
MKTEHQLPDHLPANMTHIPGVNVASGLEENFFLDHDESGFPPFANSRESIVEYIKAEFDNMEDGDTMTLVIRRKDMTKAQIEALPEI